MHKQHEINVKNQINELSSHLTKEEENRLIEIRINAITYATTKKESGFKEKLLATSVSLTVIAFLMIEIANIQMPKTITEDDYQVIAELSQDLDYEPIVLEAALLSDEDFKKYIKI